MKKNCTLACLKSGDKAEIVDFCAECQATLLSRLHHLGLTKGDMIEVLKGDPKTSGPMAIVFDDMTLALRKSEADQIIVAPKG